jgi:hypothetical protein
VQITCAQWRQWQKCDPVHKHETPGTKCLCDKRLCGMRSNALLASYRDGAAGNFHQLKGGSVADAFIERGNQCARQEQFFLAHKIYLRLTNGDPLVAPGTDGPSQLAFQSWKKSGIPTSAVLQSSTFGLATQKSDSAGDALRGIAKELLPPPVVANEQRMNPITWLGGPAEPAPRPRPTNLSLDGRHQLQMPPASNAPAAPPQQQAFASPPSPQMSQEQMQQSWSQLMRTGKVRASAAQCLCELPPDLQYNQGESGLPPPKLAIPSQSVMTIGLHPRNGGRPVRRSTAFTSNFRDPFM